MPDQSLQVATRERLSQSTDPRAASVRTELFAAAERLGRSGGTVTVTTLVREAGVSRSVFYVHFADLADFVLALQRLHLGAIARATESKGQHESLAVTREGFRTLADHFAANRDLYRAVFALGDSRTVAEGMVATIEEAVLRRVHTVSAVPAGLREQSAASFIAGGVTNLISRAVMGPGPIDVDALADDLLALMPDWLYTS